MQKSKDVVRKPKDTLPSLFKPPNFPISQAPLSLRIPHFPFPPCDLISSQCHLVFLHLKPRHAHLTSKSRTPSPLRARTRGLPSIFDMARTRGALSALSPNRTPRQRASSARVPRDSPSQAMEALQIPPFKDGVPTSPSSPAPQSRYETRRPPTTPGVTTSRPESAVRRPPVKKVRTSGLGESSRAPQPEPPIATHARVLSDFELPSDTSSESIIRRPMFAAPPIEGNSDCRARPSYSELYFN